VTRDVDRWLVGVILVSAVLFALALPRMLERLDPLTGDEPFYVMTAISILRDRDLDERNNYARRDYEEFYPTAPLPDDWRGWEEFPWPLPPHPATTHLDGLHTKHGLGLSLLIAVPYELLGRVGAVLVVLLCASLLAGQMYLLALEAGGDRRLAAAVAVGLVMTVPLAPYAYLLFPEVPAALLLLYAVRRVSAARTGEWPWLLTGAAIGSLPWLHQRFAPTAVVLALVLLVRLGRQRRWEEATTALAPVVVAGCLLLTYNLWLYRWPLQDTRDHAGFNDVAGTLNGGFGLLLDAQWGLLIVAPVYLVALVAAILWWRSAPSTARVAAAAATPYLALVASYNVWWGEWGPPARYLVPVAPLAAGALAAALRCPAVAPRVVAAVAWGWSLALTLLGLADPQRFYHHPDGWNQLVARLGDLAQIDLAGGLVAFQPFAVAPRLDRVAAVLLLAAAAVALSVLTYVPSGLRAARSAERGGSRPIVDT
jgi:hypothetical protein